MTKEELRRHIRTLHPMVKLQHHPRIAEAQTVMLYCALPDEVQTLPLINRLARQGKTVLLPRVVSDTEMELRLYTGQDDLREGAYGIMEPVGAVYDDYRRIDVAVIPGVAFDREGRRLGRGKGYYDRFLSRVPFIYKIGVCFPFQLVDALPADEHDVCMDCVIC